jgi:peptidoglycan/LPS O-acetylase OafA/YrhL
MLLNRLRRITRDGRWIAEIDGLRFVAIASVFLFHLSGELQNRSGRVIPVEDRFWALNRLIGNGDRGVCVFFVISGMILALPFARHFLLGAKSVSLHRYYMRRLTRLEPPFIVAFVLVALMDRVYMHGWPAGFGAHLVASMFYQHNLVFGTMSLINPVTWSLEIEIQFYVLAPLVMLCFTLPRKHLRRALMLVAIVAIGVAQLPFDASPRFGGSILYYVQYFLAGLLVADIFVVDLAAMKSSWAWDAAGAVALALIFWPRHESRWMHVALPLMIALLCVAAMRSYALRRVFANPVVAVVGGMCYSIYLLHFVLIAVVFKATRHLIVPSASFPVNFLIQLVVLGMPILLLCTVYFLLIERPCMDPDWPSKLWVRLGGRRNEEVEALDSSGVTK